MRQSRLACVLTSCLLALPASVGAQSIRPTSKIHIDEIRMGFPAMAEQGEQPDEKGRFSLHKAGVFIPVYIDLSAGPDGFSGGGRVIIESADSDDLQNNYTVPLPRADMEPNSLYRVLTYTKVGSIGGEVRVSVHNAADREVAWDKKNYDAIAPGDTLTLAIGSRLGNMRKALDSANAQLQQSEKSRFAYLTDDLRRLPNRWYGYQGVDLIVLCTSNREFVNGLINDQNNHKEALAEWVRRGGRLVISCGKNQDSVAQLLAHKAMALNVPVAITGSLNQDRLVSVEDWVLNSQSRLVNAPSAKNPDGRAPPIEVAKLERKPGSDLDQLIPRGEAGPLLMCRWPAGLGQVTLTAFDLDALPFSGWSSQGEFWKRLQQVTRTNPVALPGGQQMRYAGMEQENKDLASSMEKNLESFQEVSVISFGWVALFIFIYILIVGPLDYLFLKKVVKRLELTWITFPTVVLVVSAVAYFAAYSLKGHDLRINKVDLVDIDLEGGQEYGNTWFTLFSPRIQLYTIGVEPTAPAWTPEPERDKIRSGITVSWMGRPEESYGGFQKPRSQSLFRRTYDYDTDADGLLGVPIQVWSTKSFAASWERPLAAGRPPVTANLYRRAGQVVLSGEITSQLPGVLEDAALIYGDGNIDPKINVYKLEKLEPGKPHPLDLKAGDPKAAQPIGNWIAENVAVIKRNQSGGAVAVVSNQQLIKQIMFHDTGASGAPQMRNAALHYLDQSWRPARLNEVILFGRLNQVLSGAAETVTMDPVSPSRLWLDRLPGMVPQRPALDGTMTQETYVRVFIPLRKPAPADKAEGN
jgi:hypothetical protein